MTMDLTLDRYVGDKLERSIDVSDDSSLSTDELESELEEALARFQELDEQRDLMMLIRRAWRIGVLEATLAERQAWESALSEAGLVGGT
jgi:hypothetical protein